MAIGDLTVRPIYDIQQMVVDASVPVPPNQWTFIPDNGHRDEEYICGYAVFAEVEPTGKALAARNQIGITHQTALDAEQELALRECFAVLGNTLSSNKLDQIAIGKAFQNAGAVLLKSDLK
jgi:hypothetical protein